MAGVVLSRDSLLRRGLLLALLTVAWNIVEGVIAVAAAVAAGSVALLAFGIDSFVESASGLVIVWRVRAEQHDDDPEAVERVERRARRLVAVSLAALAVYVGWDAATTLVAGDRPEPSHVGLALAAVSLGVMWWLARQKRRVARSLGSASMEADAVQTLACWWLSAAVLVGVGLNALLGWWWADPLAALVIAAFIVREAREAWLGEAAEGTLES